ncbi:MAG: DUF4291 domain-containing protein [Chloroflexota bacterium]|nr:DUF4291 domain-containing protein [Chloroflexota bacterium]
MSQREIRADYDERTVVVYQAYRPDIATAAVRAGRFVPPFSLERMTWIKPSFLWMMERCGWASKPGQERVLAIRISRAGWEEALAQATLTTFEPGIYPDFDAWQASLLAAPVRVQWDPERDLRGKPQERRAIQVGISRDLAPRYVNDWTLEIRDITPLVRSLRALLDAGRATEAQARLPRERLYPTPAAIARHLGMA